LSMTPLLAALVTIAADLTSAGAIVAPRTGIVKKEIGDVGQQAARAGRSADRPIACRRGAAPPRDKDQPEMSERKHGGDPSPCGRDRGVAHGDPVGR
jgi:hypothetical protein